MRNVYLFGHGGSANHGCEAIVRSTVQLLNSLDNNLTTNLISYSPEEDFEFNLDEICSINKLSAMNSWSNRTYRLKQKLFQQDPIYEKQLYSNFLKNLRPRDLCLSIGGDTYCYGDSYRKFAYLNEQIHKRGAVSVLWGVSINPDVTRKTGVVEDLLKYNAIIVRESMTLSTLKKAGVVRDVSLAPDPAFNLPVKKVLLSGNFKPQETIGINISPLILNYSNNHRVLIQGVERFIRRIIQETSQNIALIPHVVKPSQDDMVPLKLLYNMFASTGRVWIPETPYRLDCCEIKYILSQCSAVIAARTHACVAAYSTGVPTLALGYSIKANGIAKDIFGTTNGKVVSVGDFHSSIDLDDSFWEFWQGANAMRNFLRSRIPDYIAGTSIAAEKLRELIEL